MIYDLNSCKQNRYILSQKRVR